MPHYKADILTIFGSYFGRNDRLINSFWNFLTFSDRGCNFICRKAVKLIYFEWRRTFSWVLLTSKYAVLDGLKSLHNWISHRDFSETLFVLYELGCKVNLFWVFLNLVLLPLKYTVLTENKSLHNSITYSEPKSFLHINTL